MHLSLGPRKFHVVIIDQFCDKLLNVNSNFRNVGICILFLTIASTQSLIVVIDVCYPTTEIKFNQCILNSLIVIISLVHIVLQSINVM